MRCARCQSYAINPRQHGRDGTRLDLCDVCFWRNVAEERANRIARLEEAGNRLAAFTPSSSDRFGAWRKAKEAKP